MAHFSNSHFLSTPYMERIAFRSSCPELATFQTMKCPSSTQRTIWLCPSSYTYSTENKNITFSCSLYIKLTYVMNNEHTGIFCSVFPIENILVRIQIPCLIILKLRIIKVLLKHNLPFLYISGNFTSKFYLIKLQRLSQEIEADFVLLDSGRP
jgi:hypothetical protein